MVCGGRRCKASREGMLAEIRAVQHRVGDFTDFHAARLRPCKEYAEKRPIDAINADIKDFLVDLRNDA